MALDIFDQSLIQTQTATPDQGPECVKLVRGHCREGTDGPHQGQIRLTIHFRHIQLICVHSYSHYLYSCRPPTKWSKTFKSLVGYFLSRKLKKISIAQSLRKQSKRISWVPTFSFWFIFSKISVPGHS